MIYFSKHSTISTSIVQDMHLRRDACTTMIDKILVSYRIRVLLDVRPCKD